MIILFKFMYLHFQGLVLSSVADPDADPNPDPLFRGMDPDRALDPDPCIIIQK